jgi:hypothetical protein
MVAQSAGPGGVRAVTITIEAARARRGQVLHCSGRRRTIASLGEWRPGWVEIRFTEDRSREWMPATNRVRISN